MTNPAIHNFKIQKGHYYKVPFKFPYDITSLTFIAEVFDARRNKVMNIDITKDNDTQTILCSLTNIQTSQLAKDMTVSIKQIDASGYDPAIIIGPIELKIV